ncbi:MAG: hypothetical protein CK425_04205 [Parachlamydia sp.]|nr:MAG: hypothetical protein CK425_04205 [Parachlamydia sp.]
MEKVCYWSVGDGEYALILQNLIHSFRDVGMEEDFVAFSDRPMEGATQTIIVPPFDKNLFLFKFAFLQWFLKQDYTTLIFLDADNHFVRKPPSLLDLVSDTPLHTFFESDCTYPAIRKEWWGCPLEKYVEMMRTCGVVHEKIYNVNGGFFIIRKEAIPLVCGLVQDFWTHGLSEGFLMSDEAPLAYATHILTTDPEKHLLSRHFDVWATDWTAQYQDILPDGREWIFKDYMRYNSYRVNPAIVHALKSKKALIAEGQKYMPASLR